MFNAVQEKRNYIVVNTVEGTHIVGCLKDNIVLRVIKGWRNIFNERVNNRLYVIFGASGKKIMKKKFFFKINLNAS